MLTWLFGPQVPITVDPPYPVRRRVIVNTKSGQVFRGALWETSVDFLVLKGAELVAAKNESVPVDGDVVIYRSNVSFMQVLGVAQEA